MRVRSTSSRPGLAASRAATYCEYASLTRRFVRTDLTRSEHASVGGEPVPIVSGLPRYFVRANLMQTDRTRDEDHLPELARRLWFERETSWSS